MADVNVNLSFTADTSKAKAQLQDLQSTLSNLTKNTGQGSSFKMTEKIAEASRAASELKYHLEQATNVKTGNLDFQKLNASFKESGMTLADYGKKLMALGPEGSQAFNKLISSVSAAEIPIKRANTKLQQFATTLKNTAKWQISSSLLHGFIGAVQSAYGYAQDLNESLNNIRIVTGYNVDQMAQFANEANKAAKALSTTTTAYTDASLIYYQQGLRGEDVKQRTDVTIKLANVSRQSAEEVSSQMTAIWNNFDDGTKSLEYYADAITALGAATASSSAEIAEGLQKFAAVSDTVGLSYEYATAALATVVAQTRQSADTVGTAFKTLFARIEGLKLGETLEDGTTFNQYSQALATIGVNIKDANGELRKMDDILDDLGARWKDLNRDEQVAVAQKVAGVRQYQQMIALMDNYDIFKSNVNIAAGSSGTLQEQADIYAESWEAAKKRVKASAESIYNDLLNDKGFISFLNTGSKILDMIDNFIHQLGGLKGVLATVSALVTTVFEKQLATSFSHAAESLKMMTAAGREAAQQAQQKSIEDAVTARYGQAPASGLMSDSEQTARQGYKDLLILQQQFIDNQDRMTAAQKRAAQDTITDFRESIDAVIEEQEAVENLQAEIDELDLAFLEVAAASAEFANPGDKAERLKQLQAMSAELEKFKSEQNIHLELLDDLEKLQDEGADSSAILDDISNKIKSLKNPGILSELLEEFSDTSEEAGTFEQRLAALIAEVKRLKENSAEAFKDTDAMLMNPEMVDKLTNKLNNLHQVTQKVTEDKNRQAAAHTKASQAVEQEGKAVQSVSQNLVQGMQAVSSLFSALYMLQGLWDTIKDPDTSGIEKFFKVFSSSMMILPMVIMSVTRLKAAIKGLTSEKSLETIGNTLNTLATILNTKAKKENAEAEDKVAQETGKATAEKNKNTLANLKESAGYAKLKEGATKLAGSLKSLAGVIGPVLIAIAALSAVIAAGSAVWNAENREAEKAKEVASNLSESLSGITDEYNNFANTVKSYEDLTDSMKELTAGTDEYKEALFKANNEAMQLIDNYKDLKYSINGEGLIVIDPESLKTLKEAKQESLELAQTTTLLAQEEAKRAELRVQEQKLNRKEIKSSNGLESNSRDLNTSILAGAGAGASIGGAIGSFIPIIGTAAGAAAGAIVGSLGGMVFGDLNQETSSEKEAISALSDAYKVLGNSIFTDENSLKNALAGTNIDLNDEKLISSLLENKNSIIELITATNDNSSKILALNQTLMRKAIDDTPGLKGKSDTEKKLMASGTANQLAKNTAGSMELTNLLTSNKNGFWGGVVNTFGKLLNSYTKSQSPGYEGAKDYQMYSIKELREAFAESRGYDASYAVNEGKDKTRFLDAQGNELETISNESMRILINQQKNAEEIAKSLEENAPMWDSLASKLEKYSDSKELNIDSLIGLLSGDTVSALDYTKDQITDIIQHLKEDGKFTDEELGLLNLKDGLAGVLNELGQQSDRLWNSISTEGQAAFSGYGLKTASQLDQISNKTYGSKEALSSYFDSLSESDKQLFLTIDFDAYKTQENWDKQLELLNSKENIVNVKLNISNLESLKEALANGDYETIKNSVGDYHFADFMNLSPEQQQASINAGLEQSYLDLYNNASNIEKSARQDQLNAVDAYYTPAPSFREAHQEGESTAGIVSDQEIAATEQYKAATDDLNQSLIDQQTALQGLADLYGIDKGELSSLIEAFGSLSDVLKDNEGLAAQVANRYIRLQNSVLDLSKNYKTYDEVLKNLKKSSNAVDKAALQNTESYKKLRSSVAGLLGTTEDFIDADLLEAINPADLKKAAAGDEAAIERIRDKFIELQAQIAGLNETDLSGLKKELASLKEGEVFDIDNKPFLKKLIEAQLAAGATAPEIQSLLSGLDIDADVSDFEGSMEEMAAAAAEAGSAVVADTSFDQEVETADVEQKTKGEDVAFEESFIPHPVEMTNSVLENEASDAKTVTTRVWVGNKTVIPHVISEDGTEITPAKSVKTKTAGGKEGNVKGVQIKNAHKSVGSSVSPSTSGAAKQNLGKGSKGGGGGGGGKSNPAEKKDHTKKEEVVDRYKQIEDKIKTVNKSLDKYNKLSDQAYGKSKIKAMDKVLAAKRQEIKLQQKLIDEAKQYVALDKQNLITTLSENGASAAKFDNDGNIINVETILEKMYNHLYQLEEKYNSFATKEQQDEYDKSTLSPYREQISRVRDAISLYDSSRDKLSEAETKKMDLQLEYLSTHLEKLNHLINSKIDFRQTEIAKFEKELEKLENRAFSTAQRFSLLNAQTKAYNNVLALSQKGIRNVLKDQIYKEDKKGNIITYNQKMKDAGYNTQKRNDIFDNLLAGQATKTYHGSVSEFFDTWTISEDGINALLEYQSSLDEASTALDEIKDTIDHEVLLVFNRWVTAMENNTKRMDHWTTMFDKYNDVIEKVGAYRMFDQNSDGTFNSRDQINAKMAKYRENRYDIALSNARTDYSNYETAWYDFNEMSDIYQKREKENNSLIRKEYKQLLNTYISDKTYKDPKTWGAGTNVSDFEKNELTLLETREKYAKHLIELQEKENDLTGEALEENLRKQKKVNKWLDDFDTHYEKIKQYQSEINEMATDTEEARDKVQELREKTAEDLLNLINMAQEMAMATVEDSISSFETTISGAYKTLENMQNALSLNKRLSEEYVGDYERVYELTKLNRDLEKKMDETSNIKAKEKLAKLQEKIKQYAAEGVKMSQYELDIMQKEYDLEVAKIAMEEAQNAKSQVRLTRDAEGNYSYTYTADETKVAEAEQNYEDKLNDLIKFNNEYQEKMLESQLNITAQMEDAIRDLAEKRVKGLITEEEWVKQSADLEAWYTEQYNYFAMERDKASQHQTQTYMNDYETHYGVTDKMIHITRSFSDEIVESYNEIFDTYTEAQIKRDQELYALNQAYADGLISIEEYLTEFRRINNNYATETEGATKTFKTIMDTALIENEKVVGSVKDGFNGIIMDGNSTFLPQMSNIWTSASENAIAYRKALIGDSETGEIDSKSTIGSMINAVDQYAKNIALAMEAVGITLDPESEDNPFPAFAQEVEDEMTRAKKHVEALETSIINANATAQREMNEAVQKTLWWYKNSYQSWVDAKTNIDNLSTSITSLIAAASGITPITPEANTTAAKDSVNDLNTRIKELSTSADEASVERKPNINTNEASGNAKGLKTDYDNLNTSGKEAGKKVTTSNDTKSSSSNAKKLKSAYDDLNKSSTTAAKTVTMKAKTEDTKKKIDALKKSYDNLTTAAKNAQKQVNGGLDQEPSNTGGSTQGDGKLQVGDKVTLLSQGYEDSWGGGKKIKQEYVGTTVKIDKKSSTKVSGGQWSGDVGDYYIHVSTLNGGDLGWVKKSQISGFDTGGYTGKWGRDGRFALLHQKELVLNEQDTQNMLAAVKTVREIAAMVDLQAQNANLAGQYALALNNIPTGGKGQMEQNVHITAEFPNVQDHNEVELALTSLVNRASQFAYRN